MIKYLIAPCTAALLCGCSSPKVSYYTLGSTTSGASAPDVKEQKTILLQKIVFPDYLTSHSIVTRTSQYEFTVSDSNNWGSSFDDLVTDYVKEKLRSTTGSQIISTTRYAKPDVKLRIECINFEKSEADNSVELNTRWWLANGTTDALLKHGVFKQKSNTTDDSYKTSAQAHSKLLDALIAEVTTALKSL